MKKEVYLDLMEQVVSVYTPQQIENYIAQVKDRGIWEHGFPRLGANIGILMAHGRLLHLRNYFVEIMDLCCAQIPCPPTPWKHRGNDFSVREIVCCLLELEKTDLFDRQTLERWKSAIASVDPYKCYREISPVPPVPKDNWAAFNAASEQARVFAGLGDNRDFIDNQIASQMFSFEENGMYRDPHEPMVYDVVTRVQLAAALFFGYNGTHREALDAFLKKAGLLTLRMQSVTGELPFGGRSNHFLHNETHLAAACEYETRRYGALGDLETAGQFRAAAKLAVESIFRWLKRNPAHHIKNYYPIYSMVGCEDYAYYDKYMVTAASFLYMAYMFADDGICATTCPAMLDGVDIWQTSDHFHKLFYRKDGYFVELERQAFSLYDASGIGRIQRRGAPETICLAVPVSRKPNYITDGENPCPLSICPGVEGEDGWMFAWDENSTYRVTEATDAPAWEVTLENGARCTQTCRITPEGVTLDTEGTGMVGLMLPAFAYDGANETRIIPGENTLQICYQGWVCRYSTDGNIVDTGLRCTNRNGQYRVFRAQGREKLQVRISIYPQK